MGPLYMNVTPCLPDDRYVVRDLPQEGAVSGSKTEDGSDKNVQFAKGQSCL